MYLNLEYFYYKAYLFIKNLSFLLPDILFWAKIFSFGFSCLLIVGIIYNILKLFKFRKKELAEFVKVVVESSPEERATRWNRIKKYGESDNSSDWRRAIMEADSLLEEIIEKVGYEGKTFGERLSCIHPAQFQSLNELWQAHKVRNRIAHESGHYNLTKEQTKRTLGFFEKALEELEYI